MSIKISLGNDLGVPGLSQILWVGLGLLVVRCCVRLSFPPSILQGGQHGQNPWRRCIWRHPTSVTVVGRGTWGCSAITIPTYSTYLALFLQRGCELVSCLAACYESPSGSGNRLTMTCYTLLWKYLPFFFASRAAGYKAAYWMHGVGCP